MLKFKHTFAETLSRRKDLIRHPRQQFQGTGEENLPFPELHDPAAMCLRRAGHRTSGLERGGYQVPSSREEAEGAQQPAQVLLGTRST